MSLKLKEQHLEHSDRHAQHNAPLSWSCPRITALKSWLCRVHSPNEPAKDSDLDRTLAVVPCSDAKASGAAISYQILISR